MKVGVAYATIAQQIWREIEVAEDATLEDAIRASGILEEFPEIDLAAQKVGVFGKIAKLDASLRAGDRVEIYRAITADPKKAKRKKISEKAKKEADEP